MKLVKKFWWKLYFWLMISLVIVAAFYELYDENAMEVSDVADYGTWLFSLAGVFGFAYSKVFLHRRLWRVWLPIIVVWDIGFLVKQYLQDPVELDPSLLVFTAVFFVLIVAPQYLALYLYGYRSNALWATKM